MRIGMIGLGKMGANMTHRLIDKGHEVVGHDLGPGGTPPEPSSTP
jgi:6-phosphogluconate dehydrogenase